MRSVAEVTGAWWSVALRGVVALVAAVVVAVTPIPHVENLLRVFGAYLLIDGLIDLVAAARAAKARRPWYRPLGQGLLGVLVGLANLVGAGLPAPVRMDIIALRIGIQGASIVAGTWERRAVFPATLPMWPLLLWGSASILFSVLVVLDLAVQAPLLGNLEWLACLYLVGFGVLLLALAERLRRLSWFHGDM